MKTDDVLLAVAAGGFVLTCVYLVYEVVVWQTVKASNLQSFTQARVLFKRLHATKLGKVIRRKSTVPGA
jgi:hypothetical protein